jgi:hypothetical protein
MGLFDRIRDGLGVQRPQAAEQYIAAADDKAIARYRYLLKTAPPETIEQAHAEAFAQLTPEQRRRVLDELADAGPVAERDAVMRAGDSPGALARVATRAEIRQPGVLERIFGGAPGTAANAGPGMGSLFAGSFVSSMAGAVLGSVIAQQFFGSHSGGAGLFGDTATTPANPPAHWNDNVATGAGAEHEQSVVADDIDIGGAADSGFDIGDTWDV